MKISSIVSMLAAVALCLSVGVASARTDINSTTLASTGTAAFGNAVTPGTSFAEIFSFTMPSAATTGGTSAISLQGNSINFTGLSVWQGVNVVASAAGSSLGNIFINAFNFSSGLGSWSVHVSGNPLAGAQSYGGTLTVSPVPEPKTYAMLLAGLGLLVFTTRRRKNNFS